MSRYDRVTVEQLLCTVWQSDVAAYGLDNPLAPDPDMPRARSDPARSGTLWACVADVRRAWERTWLGVRTRQVLFLSYCLHWTQKEIGRALGVSQQLVSQEAYEGIGRLMAFLNGEEYEENCDG